MQRMPKWGEEGKKLFIFQRNGCLSSSLAPNAEKKPSEWIFYGKKLAPLLAVAAAVCRRNSQLNQHKEKLTFTACSPTKSTVPPEDHP